MDGPLFHMIAGAPDPVAPFSHAVEQDGWVFVTGQMPFSGTPKASKRRHTRCSAT
jgi:2-iminobutanoate/2-iminopropanoate deaminase